MASIKRSLTDYGARKALRYAMKDPEHNLLKLLDWIDRFDTNNHWVGQRKAFRNVLEDPSSNWYQLIMRTLKNTDPHIMETFFMNFFMNAAMIGAKKQVAYREKYHCSIPWAILLDPTSACNLHCTGCWAADYGHQLNLSYEEISDIIDQGNEMGTYMYIYTGGEPLVRKKDLIRLCEEHNDSIFLCFTNGTLIDDEFAAELARVGNFIPAISIEGNEQTTDFRRGDGVYQRTMKAIENLNTHHVPFGVSVCTTNKNAEVVCSEEFYDKMIDLGVIFMWYFLYMPTGKNAPMDLMVRPDQRVLMHDKICGEFRKTKPLFAMDFWNDGEMVYGCVAGGRYYLHINARGDVEPCVFCHYSDSNIREKSLLEAYTSPLFQEYHHGQPFSGNLLRPCPMMDNAGKLAEMVARTEAKCTDYTAPETAQELCDKLTPYAEEWKPVADKLWSDTKGFERHVKTGFNGTVEPENQLQNRPDYNTMVPETAKGVTNPISQEELDAAAAARAELLAGKKTEIEVENADSIKQEAAV